MDRDPAVELKQSGHGHKAAVTMAMTSVSGALLQLSGTRMAQSLRRLAAIKRTRSS